MWDETVGLETILKIRINATVMLRKYINVEVGYRRFSVFSKETGRIIYICDKEETACTRWN